MNEPITELAPENHFGRPFEMEALRREDGVFPNAMILAVREHGLVRPRRILLPHQLYLDTFQELRAAGAEEVWVHPLFGTFNEVWTEVKLPPG